MYYKGCLVPSLKCISFLALLFLFPITANARVVENVEIREVADTLEIKIIFSVPLQYISHIPGSEGDNLRIQFNINSLNLLSPQDIKTLSERTELTWDRSAIGSLEDIYWEGQNANNPMLSLSFNQKVEFDVHGTNDQRSVVISIKKPLSSDGRGSSKYSTLLKEAMAAFRKKDYPKAIRLLTKVETFSQGTTHRQALEYLGLARQRNNQLAHAKAEYEKFLKQYPEGPDAVRVKQRLSALMTAGKKAKPKLRQTKVTGVGEEEMWDTSIYGSVSQFYFRDETSPKGEDKRVNVSNLNTDVDLNFRMRNKDYEFRFQFVGSHENNFLVGRDNRERLSRVYLDFRDKKHGARARLGRQSKSRGGVMGRFDGIDLEYEITPEIAINAVYGFPVQSSRQTNINSDRKFYGASIDFGTLWNAWDFTTYFIEQKNKGLLDRRAIGGEVRYYKSGKSLFAMVDYDIHFKELNLLMFNGNWMVSKDTTLYMSLDYRKNPLLTTTNAIQGQGVENLSDLFSLYTDDEIFLFAADRTSSSKTGTFGINQKLSDKFQISADLTATNLTGTATSGGVIGWDGTGTEYYTTVQLMGNGLITEYDSHTIGVRYNARDRDTTYALYFYSRFRVGKSFRINPRFRLDHRSRKGSNDTRLIMRPTIKMDYRIGKWLRLELEGGWEWRNETFSGIQQSSTGNYVYVGYRAIF